ncbi:MAG TPA: succinylglutamate desuccinylase/aspartoacylase family protein [Acidobacteriota bacterium]|nr:succinylglutamate desuccinylase/aspartoacylase family protein [Acidobacteriota bacterium]
MPPHAAMVCLGSSTALRPRTPHEMTTSSSMALENTGTGKLERFLGAYDRGIAGPTVVIAAVVHGNEPAGVVAFQNVLARLQADNVSLRGRFVGLAGNLAAYERGQRFVEEDFNRIWSEARVARLRAAGWRARTVDESQQRELLAALEAELGRAVGPVFFLDLHTSSAPGQPFVCIGDTIRNRRFAEGFPVPVILGLEEQVDGALLEYVNNLGHVTVGVEAGQHDQQQSIAYHEAFLTLALINAGCLARTAATDFGRHFKVLREAAGSLPPVLEVRHRHAIAVGDGFRMHRGYANFTTVSADEVVACDDTGEIRLGAEARMLLPLYQGLGNDGFFLVREVRPIWLRLSAWLRYLRLDRIAPLLPGVRRDPDHVETLIVNRRVARWLTVEIFHLFGFRKERAGGEVLHFSRRRE